MTCLYTCRLLASVSGPDSFLIITHLLPIRIRCRVNLYVYNTKYHEKWFKTEQRLSLLLGSLHLQSLHRVFNCGVAVPSCQRWPSCFAHAHLILCRNSLQFLTVCPKRFNCEKHNGGRNISIILFFLSWLKKLYTTCCWKYPRTRSFFWDQKVII